MSLSAGEDSQDNSQSSAKEARPVLQASKVNFSALNSL